MQVSVRSLNSPETFEVWAKTVFTLLLLFIIAFAAAAAFSWEKFRVFVMAMSPTMSKDPDTLTKPSAVATTDFCFKPFPKVYPSLT
jgi:cation transporter-like permease